MSMFAASFLMVSQSIDEHFADCSVYTESEFFLELFVVDPATVLLCPGVYYVDH